MSFRTLNRLLGWALGAAASGVYLCTMEASGSFWDCGEFIAAAAKLQVPHPPGAPLFVLLGRIAILLTGSPAIAVNALSAVCSGLTVAFLFWTITHLARRMGAGPSLCLLSGAVGALAFAFTDTFWFSAVEAEVYAMSSLFTAIIFRAALCWQESENDRWLVLIFFLLGLGFGVHQLTLLTIPSILLVAWFRRRRIPIRNACLALAFLLLGCTSYITVVERGSAEPAVNMNHVDNPGRLEAYLGRDQYGSYPLVYGKDFTGHAMWFPRIWDQSNGAGHARFYAQWLGIPITGGAPGYGRTPNQWDNLAFFFGYQLGWMYWRYFLWNFCGRQNDLQGFGAPRDGNAISGIPFIDNRLLGDQDSLPASLHRDNKGFAPLYGLPLLLGLIGCVAQFRRSRKDWLVVAMLFFWTGMAIVLYLNQPGNQPRERDYAYVGSFYAFSVWIGLGAAALRRRWAAVPCLLVPLLMACREWPGHDRSHRTLAFDLAFDYLESCPPDAVLFTFDDNDTYPLWFAQEAMGVRPDVRVVNTSLLFMDWYIDALRKPVNDSPPIDVLWTAESVAGDRRDFTLFGRDTALAGLRRAMESPLIPSHHVAVPGGPDFVIPRAYLAKNDAVILNIIATTFGKRPLCFTRPYDGLGFGRYLQRRGLVYELSAHADLDVSEALLLHTFRFGGAPLYLDEENRRQMLVLRQAYVDVAAALTAARRPSEARLVLETADRKIRMPYGFCSKYRGCYHDHVSLEFALAARLAGDSTLARSVARETAIDCRQEVYYYEHLSASRKTPGSDQEAQYLGARQILDSLPRAGFFLLR